MVDWVGVSVMVEVSVMVGVSLGWGVFVGVEVIVGVGVLVAKACASAPPVRDLIKMKIPIATRMRATMPML
jgi:hypothetical protein